MEQTRNVKINLNAFVIAEVTTILCCAGQKYETIQYDEIFMLILLCILVTKQNRHNKLCILFHACSFFSDYLDFMYTQTNICE